MKAGPKRDYLAPTQARVLTALALRSFGLAKRELWQAVNEDGLGPVTQSALHHAIREIRDRGLVEVESPLVLTLRNKVHYATDAGRKALAENIEVWRRIRINHEGNL